MLVGEGLGQPADPSGRPLLLRLYGATILRYAGEERGLGGTDGAADSNAVARVCVVVPTGFEPA